MRGIAQATKYVYRYATRKLDAFQAFGEAGVSPSKPHLPHSVLKPLATYSPWRADTEFRRTFEIIRGSTLVSEYRCYDLWQLVTEAGKLPAGDILEVGVWRGGTGCLMARRAELSAIPAQVYLCDTFQGVVNAGKFDRHYSGGEHSDTSSEVVRALARRLGVNNTGILTGIFPEQTGPEIEARNFRLCHIDVDVYESGREILEWVWPRLVTGGIVVFDDYGFLSTGGITRLVNEERSKPDRMMLYNLNGHAVFVKTRA